MMIIDVGRSVATYQCALTKEEKAEYRHLRDAVKTPEDKKWWIKKLAIGFKEVQKTWDYEITLPDSRMTLEEAAKYTVQMAIGHEKNLCNGKARLIRVDALDDQHVARLKAQLRAPK